MAKEEFILEKDSKHHAMHFDCCVESHRQVWLESISTYKSSYFKIERHVELK